MTGRELPGRSAAEVLDRQRFEVGRIGGRVLKDRLYRGDDAELALLESQEDLAIRLRQRGERANAVWVRSFLLENRGRRHEAVAALLAVRTEREESRQAARSWQVRAGLMGAFPHLAVRLAGLLEAEDTGRLFDAIEWAKGRALADIGEGRPATLAEMVGALRHGRVHYLTLLVDDDVTYAVLVCGDGGTTGYRLPLDKRRMGRHAWQRMIAPTGRGAPTGILSDPHGEDWRDVLAPLAEPVAAAVRSGRIRADDTLLVSADRELHMFPLHELRAGERAIGEQLAVVRVHAAADVLHRLRGPAGRPISALMVRAPTEKERDDPAHQAAFARVVEAVRRAGLPIELRDDGCRCDVAAILPALGRESLLHFMTHGDTASKGSWLERSYLLLPEGEGLPVVRRVGNGTPPGALTVAGLLAASDGASAPPLHGAHVTLQACVSGYAKANPQGDAIGLEWAFLVAGATSTLGTHWHVEWPDAAAFCGVFYHEWLVRGRSRAAAWWEAGQALRAARPGPAWAAFSLTGEWR